MFKLDQTSPLQLLGQVLNFGFSLGFIPYSFKKGENQVCFWNGFRLKLLYRLHHLTLFCYEVYLLFRCIESAGDPGVSSRDRLNLVYAFLLFLSINFNHAVTAQTYGFHHNFVNQVYQDTLSMIEELELGEKISGENRKWNRNILLCVLAFELPAFARAFEVLRHPDNRSLLSSLAPEPQLLTPAEKLLFGLLHLYLGSFHFYSIIVHGPIVMWYTSRVIPILDSLRARASSASPDKRGRMYRKLQILQIIFNDFYSIWPLAAEMTVILATVARFSLSLILGKPMYFIIALLFIISFVVAFGKFAQVHDYSKESLENWKILREPTWFPRFRRSCPPISISIGSFFVADRVLILTVLGIVTSSTASLVMMYKHEHSPS